MTDETIEVSQELPRVDVGNFVLSQDKFRFGHSHTTREDVLNLLRDMGVTSNYGVLTLDATLADSFLTKLESLPNIKLDETTLTSQMRKMLVNYTPTPHLKFELNHDSSLIKIITTFKTDYGIIPVLRGRTYNHVHKCEVMAINSIISIPAFLDKYYARHPDATIVISKGVTEILNSELNKRAAYDKVMNEEPRELFLNGIKLRPFQVKGIDLSIMRDGNFILAFEMGLGKTPTSLGYSYFNPDNDCKYLWIGPASLRPNVQREIRKYINAPTYHLTGGKPTDVDITEILTGKHKYFYINYEALSSNHKIMNENKKEEIVYPWLIIFNLLRDKFRAIVDEAHYIKNPNSARSKAVTGLEIKSKLLLTGTPMKNGPLDLYPLVLNVEPDIAGTYEGWKHAHTENNGKKAKDPKNLHEILKPIMYRLRTADVYKDLPPINRITIEYGLSPKAKAAYQDVEDGFYTQLSKWNGDRSDAQSVNTMLAQMMRMRQICGEDKIDFTCEMAVERYDSAVDNESTHPKVIIFTQFVNSPPLAQMMVEKLAPHAITTAGITDVTRRMEVVDKFQTDPNIHYIIISMSASEGLNITAAGSVITNDLRWVPDDHRQIEGRAYGRVGDLHGIDSLYIVANETIEDDVVEILAAKLIDSAKVVDGNFAESESGDNSIVYELLAKLKGKR